MTVSRSKSFDKLVGLSINALRMVMKTGFFRKELQKVEQRKQLPVYVYNPNELNEFISE